MSGVVDEHGQQWEHCNACGASVKLQQLGYEKPSTQHPYGRDLCVTCVDHGIRSGTIQFDAIVPAPTWVTTVVLPEES